MNSSLMDGKQYPSMAQNYDRQGAWTNISPEKASMLMGVHFCPLFVIFLSEIALILTGTFLFYIQIYLSHI